MWGATHCDFGWALPPGADGAKSMACKETFVPITMAFFDSTTQTRLSDACAPVDHKPPEQRSCPVEDPGTMCFHVGDTAECASIVPDGGVPDAPDSCGTPAKAACTDIMNALCAYTAGCCATPGFSCPSSWQKTIAACVSHYAAMGGIYDCFSTTYGAKVVCSSVSEACVSAYSSLSCDYYGTVPTTCKTFFGMF